MIPSRKSEIAQLGVKAMCAGFLANLMSAAIAGFFCLYKICAQSNLKLFTKMRRIKSTPLV